jgi:hypothetical protein
MKSRHKEMGANHSSCGEIARHLNACEAYTCMGIQVFILAEKLGWKLAREKLD